jgi:hypothetical protein
MFGIAVIGVAVMLFVSWCRDIIELGRVIRSFDEMLSATWRAVTPLEKRGAYSSSSHGDRGGALSWQFQPTCCDAGDKVIDYQTSSSSEEKRVTAVLARRRRGGVVSGGSDQNR